MAIVMRIEVPGGTLDQYEQVNEIMGISTKAPIYAELAGKCAGDVISFNGRELVIEEVA